jgi:hypothetical protein
LKYVDVKDMRMEPSDGAMGVPVALVPVGKRTERVGLRWKGSAFRLSKLEHDLASETLPMVVAEAANVLLDEIKDAALELSASLEPIVFAMRRPPDTTAHGAPEACSIALQDSQSKMVLRISVQRTPSGLDGELSAQWGFATVSAGR